MKFTAKRLFAAGIVGAAAIVAPLSFTVLSGGPPAVASPAGSLCTTNASADEICYVQTSGSTGTYTEYQASTGAKPTSQSVTSGGGCASPTIGGPGDPILPFRGWVYAADANSDYAGGRTAAPVTADKQRTGVCGDKGAGVQPWSIDNVAGVGAEALDFQIGDAASPEGANRLFSGATIYIANNNANAGTQVTLVESLNESGVPNGKETVVGTQVCQLGPGATVSSNTSGTGVCSNLPQLALNNTPFDTIEVQVQVGGTVSVVEGPSGPSIFTLANALCAGQPAIQPAGGAAAGVNAPLSVTQGCKTYTSYTYSDANGVQTLNFTAFSSGTPVPFTVDVTWAPIDPGCQPTPNNGDPQFAPPLQTCAVSEFQLNGTPFFDELFCPPPTGNPPQQAEPACVTNKNYKYQNDANGKTETVIEEQWSLLTDWAGRY